MCYKILHSFYFCDLTNINLETQNSIKLIFNLQVTYSFLLIVLNLLLFKGVKWIRQMLISSLMLPLLVASTAFLINFIAIYYHASRAIPFGTMVSIVWSFYNVLLAFVFLLALWNTTIEYTFSSFNIHLRDMCFN